MIPKIRTYMFLCSVKKLEMQAIFIALLYVCVAHKVIVHLCMRAGSDNMIQFVNSKTLPYLELRNNIH